MWGGEGNGAHGDEKVDIEKLHGVATRWVIPYLWGSTRWVVSLFLGIDEKYRNCDKVGALYT